MMGLISNRERLLTVFRGSKADRAPLTIYAWIYRWAQPGSPPGQGPYSPFLTQIDTRGVCRDVRRDITVDQRETTEGGRRQILMRVSTPVGELTERVEFDPGFESRWVREHMIKSVEDYAIVKYICDHTELEPTPQEYLEADSTMGEQGIIVGGLPPIPLLWLQAEVMGNGILGLGIGCARRAERKEANEGCQGVGSRGYARFKKRWPGHE
jgi:hypothetical protein